MKLEELKQKYDDVRGSTFVVDINTHNFVYANKSGLQNFGLHTMEELEGKNAMNFCSRVLHPVPCVQAIS